MTLPICWRASALDDLDTIIDYIAQRNPGAAEMLRDRIDYCVLPPTEHPNLLRPGRAPGTREVVAHPNYIVIYRVLVDAAEIVSVVHAARNYS